MDWGFGSEERIRYASLRCLQARGKMDTIETRLVSGKKRLVSRTAENGWRP